VRRALLPAILALLTAPAFAAPVAPVGSDPAGAGLPWTGVALYGTAGAPANGVGLDLGLGRTVLGAEVAWMYPGALRPELHARWPFELGSLTLAPRFSLAYGLTLTDLFSGLPSDSGAEAATGLVASLPLGRTAVFLDAGALLFSDLVEKRQLRLFGTLAGGVRYSLNDSVAVAGHLGTLASAHRFGLTGGLTVSYRLR